MIPSAIRGVGLPVAAVHGRAWTAAASIGLLWPVAAVRTAAGLFTN